MRIVSETLIPQRPVASVGMANVLNEGKKQASFGSGTAGMAATADSESHPHPARNRQPVPESGWDAVRPPGGWGRRASRVANEVITDFDTGKPAVPVNHGPQPQPRNLSALGNTTSKSANESQESGGDGTAQCICIEVTHVTVVVAGERLIYIAKSEGAKGES